MALLWGWRVEARWSPFTYSEMRAHDVYDVRGEVWH